MEYQKWFFIAFYLVKGQSRETRLKLYRFMTSLTLRARTSLTLFLEG
jgi:hypothetical protein